MPHRTRRVSLILADSNPLILTALSEVIEGDPRFSLVSTVKSAQAFIDAVTRVPVDVAILDWHLPDGSGERVVEFLRQQGSGPRIVVYGSIDVPDIVRRSMAAGAAGFCPRSHSPEQLLDIVQRVADGQMVFPFVDVRALNQNPLSQLTQRERNLLVSLSRGLTNKALADELAISVNTVKFHLRNLFEKLGVKNRAQAIALYYSSGEGAVRPFAGGNMA
ncbi:MAG: response regulator transcription factor [Hyphomicrobiales bacterium]